MRINRLTTRLRTLRPAAAALVASALLAGCSAVNDPENPCPEPEPGQPEENSLALSFRVTTSMPLSRKAPSRADSNPDHYEETYDYAFEDEVYLNDFGFFIFAYKEGDSAADPVLLYKNTNVTASSQELEITGGMGDYTVNLDLSHTLAEQLLSNPDTELSPDGSRELKVRIAIIANSGASRSGEALTAFSGLKAAWELNSATGAATFTEFTAIAQWLVFTPDYAGAGYGNLLIPMYGLSAVFTMSERDMYFSRPDDRMMLGEVSLLRAMNKVRIINSAPAYETGGVYPRVESANITYRIPSGYVTPVTPGSYVNGQQVHTDRVWTPDGGDAVPPSSTLEFIAGQLKPKSLITYLPVQTLEAGKRSVLVIKASTAPGETRDFTVDLNDDTKYPVVGSQWGTMMVRNHVYTLEITEIANEQIRLIVNVVPWIIQDVGAEYE